MDRIFFNLNEDWVEPDDSLEIILYKKKPREDDNEDWEIDVPEDDEEEAKDYHFRK